MLSPVLLEALRDYWRRLKPKTWLFPGTRAHTAPRPITSKVIWHACHQAALRAGLHKRVHPHTLRHCRVRIPHDGDFGLPFAVKPAIGLILMDLFQLLLKLRDPVARLAPP